MPALPGTNRAAIEPDKTYAVMASRLPLRDYRSIPGLLHFTRQIRKQLAGAGGLVGYSLNAQPLRKTFWACSVWEDRASLDAFASPDPHNRIAHQLADRLGPTTFQVMSIASADLPLGWARARVDSRDAPTTPLCHETNGRLPVSTTTDTGVVRSSDGTEIAYDRLGAGPAVVIIGAGPTDRSANAPVAELLAARFTVFNYDRRARGASGDTPPFTVDREYEDVAAVIKVAGGTACIFGTSGGAVIALEAAARGLGVAKLGLWEPPYVLDSEDVRPAADYEAQLAIAVTEDRPGDAVELFFTQAAGVPAEFVASLRDQPFWPAMENLAQALVYDAAILGDFRPPAERLASVGVPTLVVDGGTTPWMSRTADAIAELVAGAQRRTLTGQPHNVDATAIAPVLIDFFAG